MFFNQLKSDPLLRNSTSDIIEASKHHHHHLNQALGVLCDSIASGSLSLWSSVLVVASETSIILATRSLQVADFLGFPGLSRG